VCAARSRLPRCSPPGCVAGGCVAVCVCFAGRGRLAPVLMIFMRFFYELFTRVWVDTVFAPNNTVSYIKPPRNPTPHPHTHPPTHPPTQVNFEDVHAIYAPGRLYFIRRHDAEPTPSEAALEAEAEAEAMAKVGRVALGSHWGCIVGFD